MRRLLTILRGRYTVLLTVPLSPTENHVCGGGRRFHSRKRAEWHGNRVTSKAYADLRELWTHEVIDLLHPTEGN